MLDKFVHSILIVVNIGARAMAATATAAATAAIAAPPTKTMMNDV